MKNLFKNYGQKSTNELAGVKIEFPNNNHWLNQETQRRWDISVVELPMYRKDSDSFDYGTQY